MYIGSQETATYTHAIRWNPNNTETGQITDIQEQQACISGSRTAAKIMRTLYMQNSYMAGLTG